MGKVQMHKVIQTNLNLSLRKESLEKKTSKNFEMKVNSISKFDYYIKNSRIFRVVGTSASVMLAIVMTLTIAPIVIHSSIAEAAPGAAVASNSYLTMTADFESANLDLTITDTNGTFNSSSSSELAKFNVATNNYTGYTLSIAGADDNSNSLTNASAGTELTSIDTALTSNLFDSATYNGKWGYFPSKYNSEDNLVFRPAPTVSGSTLDETSSANSKKADAKGDTVNCDNYNCNEYTIGLGARADYATKAGTYTSTFILTAVGKPVGYAITYADNSGDNTVSNLPDRTVGTTSATSINLTNSIPTRDKYAFVAWCLGTVSNNGTTCTGTTYTAGAIYNIDQTSSNIATLYAVWKLNTFNITIKTATGISSVSLDGNPCSSADGCVVEGLVKGEDYKLTATAISGYTFSSWSAGDYGSIASTSSDDTYYTVGGGDSIITPSATANVYTLTLDNTSATSKGSEKARVTFNTSNLYGGTNGTSKITNPSRTYTISGFTKGSGATDASITSTSSLTSTYTFNGWYTTESGGNQIINTSGVLNSSTAYTNSNGQWISTEAPTLYAQWLSGSSVTLPIISKTGYTCSWNTKSDGSGVGYTSGGTFTPTASYPLYGVCTPNKYTITIKTANGISEVKLNGNSCKVTTGCEVANLEYGKSYSLVATLDSNYNFTSWAPGDYGSIANTESSSTTYTVGLGNSTITPSALGKPYTITFRTTDASSIVFNGIAYTNNQTASANYGSTYVIYGNYASKYTFKSWAATAGNVANNTYQTTTYTAAGAATITLTGQSVSTTIQSITASTCTTTPTPAYDSRDNEVYWFAKLADGNCWMLDNMRLGGTSSKSISSSTSNSSGSFTIPASGKVCFTGSSCTGTSGATGTGYTVPAINADNKDTVVNQPQYIHGAGSNKTGIFYNFCAASAGSYCMQSSTYGQSASYDICPKNWRLPTGGDNSDWQTLYSAYGGSVINFYNATSLAFPGFYENNTLMYSPGWGIYSTSIRGSGSTRMWRVDVYVPTIAGFSQQDYGDRAMGLSVRCMLRGVSNNIKGTMQNAPGKGVYANGSTGTLTDSRDSQIYTVAQVNGNLWMTRNLAIGCNGSGSTYGSGRTNRYLYTSSSNVNATLRTDTFLSLDKSDNTTGCTTSDTSACDSYTTGRMKCSATYGAWYNFAAASAGTIAQSGRVGEAQYSICPVGWRLPTKSEWNSVTSYSYASTQLGLTVQGGSWHAGSIYTAANQSQWWSSTPFTDGTYDSSNGTMNYGWSNNEYNTFLATAGARVYGDYIRCIRAY